MKNLICSAVAILFAVSAAQAQQAVQWRVQDGGNGHWYQGVSPSPLVSWFQAKHRAEQVGGHLTTFGTAAEHAFVYQHIASDPRYWHLHQTCGCMSIGPWIGLRRENGFWSWVTGEPVTFTSWHPSEPWEPLDFVRFFHYVAPLTPAPLWDNFESGEPGGDPSTPTSYLVEWSADCNNDGIVDYGQCLDGTLPDTNGNNIPDCCETGEACVVGNYPVQWRVEDGGNGHWYQLRYTSDLRWETANIEAQLLGGHLATLTSPAENQRVYLVAQSPTFEGPYFGGFKNDSGECEWVTGERFVFSNWGGGEPNGGLSERFLHFKFGPVWNDVGSPYAPGYLVEWSADCNNDGIVDKGQILRGELPDVNANGIPDPCETPTCRDADLLADRNVNGIDLGILLGQWGPNTQYTISDITRDGVVDGNDLGLLLSFWGPCPY